MIAAFDGNATVSGSTITLTGDVTVSGPVIFESGDWTLNLASYTLTGANGKAAIGITGGSLTVTGSGSVKGGIGAVAIQATRGNLTIQGSVSITGGTGDYGGDGGYNGKVPGAGGSGGAFDKLKSGLSQIGTRRSRGSNETKLSRMGSSNAYTRQTTKY